MLSLCESLFDLVACIRFRLRKPTGVRAALYHCFPIAPLRDALGEFDRGDLLQFIANRAGMSEREVLSLVAHALGLSALPTVSVPSQALLEDLPLPAEELRALGVLPQFYEGQRILAIVDPERIFHVRVALDSWPMMLASETAVDEIWSRVICMQVDPVKLDSQTLWNILGHLSAEAQRQGATEIFIGHPTDSAYEFRSSTGLFRGELHPDVFQALWKLCSAASIARETSEDTGVRELRLSQTRNFEKPILCLSWEEHGRALPAAPAVSSSVSVEPKTASEEASPIAAEEVLLVDDDARFLSILERVLSSRGWTVQSQSKSELALQSLIDREVQPRLIVCDVHMPRMDGVEFVKRLRQSKIRIPVLMLTSDEDPLLEAELALLGVDAFVRKHEDLRVLLAWCSNLVKKRQSDGMEDLAA